MSMEFRNEERLAQPALTKRTRLAVSDMPAFFDETFSAVMHRLGEAGQRPAGPPFAIYHNMDMENLDVEAGFPLTEAVDGNGHLTSGHLPGGKFCTAVHVGPYDQLPGTWSALWEHIREQGWETDSYAYEVYLTDPTTVPPEEIQTQIFVPLK